VIAKPAGVFVSSGGEEDLSLPNLLRERGVLPEDEPLRVVHRLHEQASGVVLYARTADAQRNLRRQFADGRAEVTYLALVTGYVEDDGEIDIPLRFDKRTGKLVASSRRGTPSRTCYRIVERIAGNTLLEVRPVRERTDQIRIHLAAIGHPLTVDPGFGGGVAVLLSDYKSGYRPSERRPERPLVERLTLHAAQVLLSQPTTGAALGFDTPLPKDLRATLTQLRRLR
jgi:23S rRNA-/tRNA-specific pseudouridylate synthase